MHVPHNKKGTAIDDGMAYMEDGNCGNKSLQLAISGENETALLAYPNPFEGSTTIDFTVPVTGIVSIKVYNAIGEHVETLYEGIAEKEIEYTVVFNATEHPKGIYYYNLLGGNNINITKKLILIK